jgi:hypothetical protein
MTITVGSVYNYGGDNYVVTRYEPNHFLVQVEGGYADAVGLTDHVKPDETATVDYVLPASDFEASYIPGEIVEGEEPPEASQLPADQLPPSATTLPVEPDEDEAEPKG